MCARILSAVRFGRWKAIAAVCPVLPSPSVSFHEAHNGMYSNVRKGSEARHRALAARAEREHLSWISSLLDLHPADRVLVLSGEGMDATGAPFDKAYGVRIPPGPALEALLHDARHVLKPYGRIACLAWPVEPAMYDRPFRPEDDTLVQEVGEALAVHLRAAGFRDVRLRFRPTKPVASVCAVAVNRSPRPSAPPAAFFFGGW